MVEQEIYCSICGSATLLTIETGKLNYTCHMCRDNLISDGDNRVIPDDNYNNDLIIDCYNR